MIIPVPPVEGQPLDIMHGGSLVLVDQKGQVRGRYKADEVDVDSLLDAVKSLL